MVRISIIATMAAILSSSAFAEDHEGAPPAPAKVPLEAAVATAQQHVKGRATKAEYERQKDGQWAYEVEVTAGAKVFEVKVDADKGTVLKSVEDDEGKDGDKGERD